MPSPDRTIARRALELVLQRQDEIIDTVAADTGKTPFGRWLS